MIAANERLAGQGPTRCIGAPTVATPEPMDRSPNEPNDSHHRGGVRSAARGLVRRVLA